MASSLQTSNIHTVVALCSLSLVTISLDCFTNFVSYPKQVVTWVTYGIQRAANFPGEVVTFSGNYLGDRNVLLSQIDELEGELQELSAQNYRLRAHEESNVELRELLGITFREPTLSYAIAELAAPIVAPAREEITVNRGTTHGIQEGAAVLDAAGVFGQVVEVLPHTSRVLLVTDNRIAVPVRNERSGLHGILSGVGDKSNLTLEHTEVTDDVAEGDLLITSGLGGTYPYGYPVGVITSLEFDESGVAARVTVEPLAQLHRRRFILIVTGTSAPETTTE